MSFAITPKSNCPHVLDPLQFYPTFTEQQLSVHQPCYACNDVTENWMSLSPSHTVACSRFVNGHMAEYAQTKGFCLAVSFSDLSVWCYQCDSYIISPALKPMLNGLHRSKFGISIPEAAEASNDSATSTSADTNIDSANQDNNGNSQVDDDDDDLPAPHVDTPFAVIPKTNCPHVLDPLQYNEVFTDAQLKIRQPCYVCGDKSENWISLGPMHTVACSRYVKGHMSEYAQEKGFCLALSFSDLSVWCYQCDSYIESPRLREVLIRFHAKKFGLTPAEVAATATATGPVYDPNSAKNKNKNKNKSGSTGGSGSGSGSSSSSNNRSSKPRGVGFPHQTDEEVREHFDTPEDLERKVKEAAAMIRAAKHVVVYTGAGISTSAKIPDYRGPQGVWTLLNKGEKAKGIDIEQALPTYAHYALRELGERGVMKFLVSTNVDGLHRRSGVPESQLAELHGNCYKETCARCNKEYLRTFDTTKTVVDYRAHITGRRCDCGGLLKDTIIHFSENLPEGELRRSIDHANKSDLALVIGTSLRVQPACLLPKYALGNGGKVIIVNLQMTPLDNEALKIHARSDEFMQLLMQELAIPVTHDTPIY